MVWTKAKGYRMKTTNLLRIRDGLSFARQLGVVELQLVTENHGNSRWYWRMHDFLNMLRDALEKGIIQTEEYAQLLAEAEEHGLLADFTAFVNKAREADVSTDLCGEWSFQLCQAIDGNTCHVPVDHLPHGHITYQGNRATGEFLDLEGCNNFLFRLIEGELEETLMGPDEAAAVFCQAIRADVPIDQENFSRRMHALPHEVLGKMVAEGRVIEERREESERERRRNSDQIPDILRQVAGLLGLDLSGLDFSGSSLLSLLSETHDCENCTIADICPLREFLVHEQQATSLTTDTDVSTDGGNGDTPPEEQAPSADPASPEDETSDTSVEVATTPDVAPPEAPSTTPEQ